MPPTLVQLGRKTLKLSNLDKLLYPAADFTKGQVIDYYRQISPILLPHLKDRPLTLKRYPDGVDSLFFYEKRCPAHKPDWVKTAHIWSDSNNIYVDYCLINDLPTLLWVANLASIELHVLLSKAKSPNRPTTMVFDLDPGPGVTLQDCATIALRMRDLLSHIHLQSFPKTSGGKGLHLYVPLNHPRVTFDQTKSTSRAIAMTLEKDDPARVTSNMRKDLRKNKVFIDWSQNDDHKTTAAPYTLRALAQPFVSTPLTWEEIESLTLPGSSKRRRAAQPMLQFTAPQLLSRVTTLGDLLSPLLTLRQALP
jgi:bifunctional non-homologous end joining protein LigD